MTTNTAAGLKDIHTGVVIGKANKLTHVDPEVVTHQRKLIGKCNVHITEAVFGKLAQLSGARRRHEKVAFAEG